MVDDFRCPNDSDGDNNCHLCYRSGHCFEHVRWLEKQLAIYKEKTPHTADGVPILMGDSLWVGGGDVCYCGEVTMIEAIDDPEDKAACLIYIDFFKIINGMYFSHCENKFFYSTREALDVALKRW